VAPNDAVREVLRHPSEVSVGRVPASPRLFQSGFCGTIKHGGCQILAAYAIGSSRARCAGSAPDAATAEIWHGAARTGQIRLWGFSSPWKSERCCGAGVRLRCMGSSAMVSRNQWNNAKRAWFLVSQTVENSDWRSGRYRYRAPLQAFRWRAVRPKLCRRVELSL